MTDDNMNQQDMFGGMSRKQFWDLLEAGKDLDCPCCGRYSKIYKRRLHCAVALQLIRLYKLTAPDFVYIHTSKLILPETSGMSDFGKAYTWGLVDPMPHEPGKKKTSGFWRLNTKGQRFVEGKESITEFAYMFDDTTRKFTGAEVTIKDVLAKKFNYVELMAAT